MPESIANTAFLANDSRSITEQLITLAEIGSEAPEALTLAEVRSLCRAFLQIGSDAVHPSHVISDS